MHDDQLYFDYCLAFGNQASAGIFCHLADLVAWIATEHGLPAVIHYIDDFLIILPPLPDSALTAKMLFRGILDAIGMLYKQQKMVSPTT